MGIIAYPVVIEQLATCITAPAWPDRYLEK